MRRYGPGGEFWQQHPELPQLPIRSWQVWNEPNIPVYWPSGPEPRRSTPRCCARSAQGIKAVDPGAKVVTAGLNESELGIKLVPFLEGMYRAGGEGKLRRAGAPPVRARLRPRHGADLSRAVRELRRNGDPARTLVTELGWATGSPSRRALVVSEAGQASLIRRHVTELARFRGRLRLDGIFYFNWRDVPPAPGSARPLGPPHRPLPPGRLAEARAPGAHRRDLGDLLGLTSRRALQDSLHEPRRSAEAAVRPPRESRSARASAWR